MTIYVLCDMNDARSQTSINLIMRLASAGCTCEAPKLRLRLRLLEVNRCRLPALWRFNLPLAVSLNRFFAERLLFILGIEFPHFHYLITCIEKRTAMKKFYIFGRRFFRCKFIFSQSTLSSCGLPCAATVPVWQYRRAARSSD